MQIRTCYTLYSSNLLPTYASTTMAPAQVRLQLDKYKTFQACVDICIRPKYIKTPPRLHVNQTVSVLVAKKIYNSYISMAL